MGVRFESPELKRNEDVDLVSEAVAPGTIQVPPSGRPILLLGDCQTIGGYPKIAHVITVDLPIAAQLRPGDIFLAYSDGVTEPENDFGEFGEPRLIELVQENRDLPLDRITEIVTAAVDDWIGSAEQPDDVTLVLARAR